MDWARTTYPQIGPGGRPRTSSDRAPRSTSTRPCALGGALDDETVPALRAEIVAGAANNQLAHPGIDKLLADRGILYAPDYVVNAGGVIQVADEIEGFNFDRAKLRATKIFDTTEADPRTRPTPRGYRRPSRRTGWPSGGWPKSVACVPSGSNDL